MTLRAAVASLIVLAALARPATACDTCAAPAAVLPPPLGDCQFQPGQTDSSCRTDVYAVDLSAGDEVVFTLCDWTCAGSFATFNAKLRILGPSCTVVAQDDDWCGMLPEVTYLAPASGRYFVEVTGSTSSDVGSYRLGYFKYCWAEDCWAPGADLGPVTTSCQLVTGTVDCGSKAYSVTLVQGQRYTFSLCGATCPGAEATFDSAIDLYDPSGLLVASSGTGCGDDAEIVYQTDPASGGGTYCVQVLAESGGGRFALGYRVACQAPSGLGLSPLNARATQPGCSEPEVFTITSGGTATFDADWSIVPPPGATATPASGSFVMGSNAGQFSATLAGIGTYRVTVTLTNECGTSTRTFDYALADRTAPDLTLSATAGCGAPPPLPAPAPAPAPAPDKSLHSARERVPTPEVLAHAEAKRAGLERAAAERLVLNERMPGLSRPPQAKALGCAAPCTSGVLRAEGALYDVFLSCDDGSFTARTGAAHPVTITSGFRQNVIFGGATESPGTSDAGFYFHDSGTFYQDPGGGRACVFDPPDTAAEPNSIGIEMEWDVEPEPGVIVTLREEIVAFGTDEADSGVRLSLGAISSPSSMRTARMGVRWQIDYQNGGDDGPFFATVSCNPPEVVQALEAEHELLPGEIQDFYRIQNNTGDPIFSNFTNTTEIAGFPDTGRPDRLVYGYWPNMVDGWWDRGATEGDVSVDWDSAVHYWFGPDAGTAIPLAPGESFMRSVVIFTSGENADCGGFTPGNAANADLTVCEGDCAELGALAEDACGTASVRLVESTPGAPPCTGNPCEATFDAPGTWQYTWEATDDAGNATRAVTTVLVTPAAECLAGCAPSGAVPPPELRSCEGEPVVLDASSMGLSGCGGSLVTQWREGTRVIGSTPSVTVSPTVTTTYTVTVSCSSDPGCFTSAAVTVRVDRRPVPGAVTARDLARCNLGILVTWDAAEFFNGGGVYNLFRSTVSCADALLRAPLATGLTGLSYLDSATDAGASYHYVVQAEDDPTGTPCRPLGAHHGGPAATACAGPATDVTGETQQPDPVWAALRVGHQGQRVILTWPTARALQPGEHFHVLKSPGGAPPVESIGPEGLTLRTWQDIDTSSRLQLFDVRIADACENLSPREYPIYPPGYDVER